MFDGLALVIFLFAFGEGDDEFDVAGGGEEFGGDYSVAEGFLGDEMVDLFFGGEEANIFSGERGESEVIEPELVVFDGDETALELDAVVTDVANLETGEGETDGELVAELIIETGATVDDGGWWSFRLFHDMLIIA